MKTLYTLELIREKGIKKGVLLLMVLIPMLVFSQKNENLQEMKEYNTALVLMDKKLYSDALPIWEKLSDAHFDNANYSYNLGLCLFESRNNRVKALPHFMRAATNIALEWDNRFGNQTAPIETYFYLGKLHQLVGEFDKAIYYYTQFELNTRSKSLVNDARHGIIECVYAKDLKANKNPQTIINAGEPINSTSNDYFNFANADSSLVVYTTRRIFSDKSNQRYIDASDGMQYENVFMLKKQADGSWSKAEKLPFCTNENHEACVAVSSDFKTIYIASDIEGSFNLYSSTWNGITFEKLEKLPEPINSTANDLYFTINNDGTKAIVSSDRKGGLGSSDLYLITKDSNGNWSKAKNLGKTINSEKDEVTPSFYGNTIYFSSNGLPGIGGFDIFSVKLNDDGTFEAPSHLGMPINTGDNEIGFYRNSEFSASFATSFQNVGFKGGIDCYVVEYHEEKTNTPITYEGKLEGLKSTEYNDLLITLFDVEGKYEVILPNPKEGTFKTNLIAGEQYELVVSTGDKIRFRKLFRPSIDNVSETFNMRQFASIDTTKMVYEPFENELAAIQPAQTQASNSAANSVASSPQPELKAATIQLNPNEEVKVNVSPPSFNISRSSMVFYHQYFGFNNNNLSVNDIAFKKFVEDVVNEILDQGYVNIAVEASASKLPTKSFGNNQELAEKRAKKAQDDLMVYLKKIGATENQIKFVYTKALVQGPDYDPLKYVNPEEYLKYQYIKMATVGSKAK